MMDQKKTATKAIIGQVCTWAFVYSPAVAAFCYAIYYFVRDNSVSSEYGICCGIIGLVWLFILLYAWSNPWEVPQ